MQGHEKIPSGLYWVQKNKLLAGEYPNAFNSDTLKGSLRQLLEIGVTFFIDLTEEGEKALEPYDMVLRKQAGILGKSVEYRRMPFPDFDVPVKEDMRNILDTVNKALEEGHIVYFHCFAGIGRTGTVAGCYLAELGFTDGKALDELSRLQQGTEFEKDESPITPEQRQMVIDWKAF